MDERETFFDQATRQSQGLGSTLGDATRQKGQAFTRPSVLQDLHMRDAEIRHRIELLEVERQKVTDAIELLKSMPSAGRIIDALRTAGVL